MYSRSFFFSSQRENYYNMYDKLYNFSKIILQKSVVAVDVSAAANRVVVPIINV